MNAVAVIVAGGSGRRIGGEPKQFREVGGRPMLEWSCALLTGHPDIGQVVAVVSPERAKAPPAWLRDRSLQGLRVVPGGPTRRASVHAGLTALASPAPAAPADYGSVVLIHDAARPFVSATLIGTLTRAAAEGPVIPVLPIADTIKRLRSRRGESGYLIDTTLDRTRLRAAQTPQAFPLGLILRLHGEAAEAGVETSDDAALCEAAGIELRTVPGEPWAWKITRPEDLEIAEWLVASGRIAWPGEA